MTSPNQEQFQLKYQAGQDLLERGQYRLSVQTLEEATELVNLSSQLGGEVQMWLVTAYQAVGKLQNASALCQTLTLHPHPDIRKQSQEVLYILQAPKLKRPEEWMIKIPDLEEKNQSNRQYIAVKSIDRLSKKFLVNSEDSSRINTDNNYFNLVILGIILLILGVFFGHN